MNYKDNPASVARRHAAQQSAAGSTPYPIPQPEPAPAADIDRTAGTAELPVPMEVIDPLDGLLNRFATDKSAVFTPAVLDRLNALTAEQPIEFEEWRRKLKKAGVRLGYLDKALRVRRRAASAGSSATAQDKPSTVQMLLAQTARWVLFHNPDKIAFAEINVGGHTEVWPLWSREINLALRGGYYKATEDAPGAEAVRRALMTLEAKAVFEGPQIEVHFRVGEHDGKIYLYLADSTRNVVEIDADGWRVISGQSSPVKFRHSRGMEALPIPELGGRIDELRPYFNVRSEAHFVLLVACLLDYLSGHGPFVVLVFNGEQGAAKSSSTRLVRALVDPNQAPVRAQPKDDRDFHVTAMHSHLLAFDNVSSLPGWLSDALCQMATGAGFAARKLFTDDEQVILSASKPIILNGITDFVGRPDLADRSIFLKLLPISDDRRRPEREIWDAFEAVRPRILGVLLDAVAHGLRTLPATRPPKLPRMADFVQWVSACEGALWEEGTFLAAYRSNQRDATDDVIEANPVPAAVLSFMRSREQWTGTAGSLLRALETLTDERRSKDWPTTPRGLRAALDRSAPVLRRRGIDISYVKGGPNNERLIRISRRSQETPAEPTEPPDAMSGNDSGGSGGPDDTPGPIQGEEEEKEEAA